MQTEKSGRSVKKIAINIARAILILWGILWAVGNIASIFLPYKQVIQESSTVLDANSQVISTTAFEDPASQGVIEQIFKASFRPFLILSTISVILGILVLYNGRTFLEMIYMFDFFMIPRQRRYWGSILDTKTRGTISLASVTLLQLEDGKEKLVGRTVSDLDGHYRINVPDLKGKYLLEVKAEGYQVYRKEVDSSVKSIVNRGEFLEDITIERLDQQTASLKSSYYKLKSKLYIPLLVTLFILAIMGFVLYVNQSIVKPGLDSFLGAVFFGIAVGWNIIIATERIRNRSGKILDENNKPIHGVVVRLFKDNNQTASLLSDANGIVKFQTEAGVFKILVNKEGYVLPGHSENDFLEVKINNDGYLSRNIIMHSTGKRNIEADSSLMNPFEK